MKLFLKIILTFLAVLVISAGGFWFLMFGTYQHIDRDLEDYSTHVQSIRNAADFMPELDSLGAYTDIQYAYKEKCYSRLIGFYSDGLSLFVTYDAEQYCCAKETALSGYAFLEEPVKGYNETYELPIEEFQYNGYTIKVVPDGEYLDYCACKSFMMLGYNDAECTIAYLYYWDFDIDYISEVGEDPQEEMGELIDTAFAWAD